MATESVNPLDFTDIEKTFSVTLTEKGTKVERVLGVRFNSWGMRALERAAGLSQRAILERLINSDVGYNELLGMLVGGLEGYRYEHKNRGAEWTLEDAARIMDAMAINGKTPTQALSVILLPPFMAAQPRVRDVEASGESGGDVAAPLSQTGEGNTATLSS